MTMPLMDSDVAIDIQRKHPPALKWLASQTGPVAIAGFAALEMANGCRNKAALQTLYRFLKLYPIVWPSQVAMTRALIEYAPLRLSHNVGAFDALIAATAIETGSELLTFNTRHFVAVSGLIIQQPYQR